MNNIKERIKIFSGAKLKYIAFASMLIDHFNKAIIYPNLDGGLFNRISDLFDILGRIAFPIFIFLLIEGYFHTRNKWKYLGTLLLFGIISEVPFDMCTSAVFFEPNWNNIMFTLSFVLAIIWVIDVLKEKLNKPLWYVVSILIVAVMCFVAMNLGLDYEHHAVLIGYFMYIFHDKYIYSILSNFKKLLTTSSGLRVLLDGCHAVSSFLTPCLLVL